MASRTEEARHQRLAKTRYPGIYRVHSRSCDRSPCRCKDRYQATVYIGRDKKLVRKHFDTLGAARTWREDAGVAVRAGKLRAPTKTRLEDAAEKLIAGMKDGSIYDRSGKRYKPATIRGYARNLRLHILPRLGGRKLSQIERRDMQHLVEHLHGEGFAASTINNILDPMRVIYRRAVHTGDVMIDPTDGLNLPTNGRPRDRVADRAQAQTLINALPEGERALWATAFYAGLRRGELRALRWSDVDLAAEPAVIHVRRTWDDSEGELDDTKPDAGRRMVPLIAKLRVLLAEHGLRTTRAGDDLVFGRTAADPFTPTTIQDRAMKAWGWKQEPNPEPAGPRMLWVKARPDALRPLTPHEARHSAASYLIEAGLNDLELMATIGHSDPRTTETIYGRLFPDSAATIAAKLDAYHDDEASSQLA
jgi:integrase